MFGRIADATETHCREEWSSSACLVCLFRPMLSETLVANLNSTEVLSAKRCTCEHAAGTVRRQHREKLSSFANCLAADAQHPTFQVVSSKASTQPGSGAASDRRQS